MSFKVEVHFEDGSQEVKLEKTYKEAEEFQTVKFKEPGVTMVRVVEVKATVKKSKK